MSVRELFKRKLGNAQLVPDASVNSMLMRKVARREFIRFNPARFNIYYFTGLVAATVTASILIFSDGGKSDEQNTTTITNSSPVANKEILSIPSGTVINLEKGVTGSKETEGIKVSAKTEQKTDPGQDKSVPGAETRNIDNIIPAGIDKSVAKTGINIKSSSDKLKLKGGYRDGDVLFETSANSGCLPLKLHFRNKLTSFDSCKWTFGDGGFSNKINPDWIFDLQGEYKVRLEVFGPDGYRAAYSKSITVHAKPQAKFEITPEQAVLPDDEIRFLNYSSNSIKFNWDFGDGTESDLYEPRHSYSKFGNYNVQLIAKSEYGCTDTLIVRNAFPGSEYYILFPNAFVPNPDGPSGGYYSSKSDEASLVFHPSFSGVSEYQLRIFSKRSILIFESNDINIGWDGYFKGELVQPGVYIWKVRGNFRNGEPFVKMGDVTLLKN